MAETDTHRDEMMNVILALQDHYRDDPRVYVAGNLLVYYEEDHPEKSVAPDAFVVFGIPKHRRRTYKVWEEGKAPDVVIEITSADTRRRDRDEKRLLYESLGVREFFMFDPLGEYLKPPLQGFRLAGEYYAPLAPEPSGRDGWRLTSEALGLELRAEGDRLRLFDSAADRYLLSPAEEAEARRAAEAEVERLRAELRRLRGEGDS